MDTHVRPPFKEKDGQVVDRYGEHIDPYPETVRVLEKLKADGIPMGVASR